MDYVKAGTSTPVVFDLCQVGFAVESAVFVVMDELGNQLFSGAASPFDPAPATVTALVPAIANALQAGAFIGAREVILTVEGGGQTAELASSYVLEGPANLKVPERSTLTRLQADLLAEQTPELRSTWSSFDERTKTAALLGAFEKMAMIALQDRDYGRDTLPDQRVTSLAGYGLIDVATYRLRYMSESDFAGLSPSFRIALQRAQLFEACDAQARAGSSLPDPNVSSIKVGESTTTFRHVTQSDALGERAKSILRRYMCAPRIGRA